MTKICIYGCGKIGKEAVLDYHKKPCIDISFICDKDPEKWGSYQGIKVISPQALKEQISNLDYILIATTFFEEVIAELIALKVEAGKIRIYDSCSQLYKNSSWSQDGEDVYLQQKYKKQSGFYIDVGGYHPFRFSNTAWAYARGWRGINIEPNVDLFRLFQYLRPGDININCGISDKEGEMSYYCYEEAALNGFDAQLYSNLPVMEERKIEVRTLSSIMKEYNVEKVDFLDIDVEGLEMKVLKSIDFSVDIDCILLEQFVNADSIRDTMEYRFLKERGYSAVAKYGRTTIYEK